MGKGARAFAGLLLLLGILGWAGRDLLFSVFMTYDDEGYVLLSLRDFGRVGGLYDTVYSQYGPFFFLAGDTLRRVFDFEWTNNIAREVTLAHWLLSAGLCAGVVWRATRSFAASAVALVFGFAFLWVNLSEPSHPGSAITLMMMAAAWLVTRPEQGKGGREALVLGCIGAASALIKINVGALLVLSLLVIQLRADQKCRGKITRVLLALCAALLPWVLMLRLLHEPWVWRFALVASLAGAGTIWSATDANDDTEPPVKSTHSRRVPLFLGAGLFTTLFVVGWIMLRGTSATGLLHGLLLDPLRHPGVYSLAFNQPPFMAVLALGAFLLTLAWPRLRRNPRAINGLAWLKVALIGVALAAFPVGFETKIGAWVLAFLLPLTPLLILSSGAKTEEKNTPTTKLALLFVLQVLHAYPVAGSQIRWGALLWIPLLLCSGHEALRQLPRPVWPGRLLRLGQLASALVVVALVVKISRAYQTDGVALGLPGAENIVIPTSTATAIQCLTANATAQGDMLATLPGCYSFNLWSGLPTPTLKNATHWFNLLSGADQNAIIRSLESARRPVLIVQRDVLSFLSGQGRKPEGPLVDYLLSRFSRQFIVEGYSFWTRADTAGAPRRIAWLALRGEPAVPALHLVLEPALAARAAGLETIQPVRPIFPPIRIDPTNPAIRWQPTDETGLALGPDQPLEGLKNARPGILVIPLPEPPAWAERAHVTLRVLDARGVPLLYLPVLPFNALPPRWLGPAAASPPRAN